MYAVLTPAGGIQEYYSMYYSLYNAGLLLTDLCIIIKRSPSQRVYTNWSDVAKFSEFCGLIIQEVHACLFLYNRTSVFL